MISCFMMKISLLFCAISSLVTLSDAISCQGSATYKLTFKAEWTSQSHPEDFPAANNPHFSSLVGCSHNSSYVMWEPGMNATKGVKDVAELGSATAMYKEIDQQITLKRALDRFNAGGIRNVGSTSASNIQVNTHYPLVSAITMIAPSPDWFVGVHDYSLCNQTSGKWIDKRIKDLFLYDSGTDSAPRFVHTDTPTIPPVPIFLLTNTHEGSLKSNNTIKRFGTFSFEKTAEVVPEMSSTTSPTTTNQMPDPTTKSENLMKPSMTVMSKSMTASMKPSMTVPMTTPTIVTSRPSNRACSFFVLNIYVLFTFLIASLYT